MDTLTKLINLCTEWGGRVREVVPRQWELYKRRDLFSEAPFASYDLGMFWYRKSIIHVERLDWFDLVHEMGHVFAVNVPPWKCVETDLGGSTPSCSMLGVTLPNGRRTTSNMGSMMEARSNTSRRTNRKRPWRNSWPGGADSVTST